MGKLQPKKAQATATVGSPPVPADSMKPPANTSPQMSPPLLSSPSTIQQMQGAAVVANQIQMSQRQVAETQQQPQQPKQQQQQVPQQPKPQTQQMVLPPQLKQAQLISLLNVYRSGKLPAQSIATLKARGIDIEQLSQLQQQQQLLQQQDPSTGQTGDAAVNIKPPTPPVPQTPPAQSRAINPPGGTGATSSPTSSTASEGQSSNSTKGMKPQNLTQEQKAEVSRMIELMRPTVLRFDMYLTMLENYQGSKDTKSARGQIRKLKGITTTIFENFEKGIYTVNVQAASVLCNAVVKSKQTMRGFVGDVMVELSPAEYQQQLKSSSAVVGPTAALQAQQQNQQTEKTAGNAQTSKQDEQQQQQQQIPSGVTTPAASASNPAAARESIVAGMSPAAINTIAAAVRRPGMTPKEVREAVLQHLVLEKQRQQQQQQQNQQQPNQQRKVQQPPVTTSQDQKSTQSAAPGTKTPSNVVGPAPPVVTSPTAPAPPTALQQQQLQIQRMTQLRQKMKAYMNVDFGRLSDRSVQRGATHAALAGLGWANDLGFLVGGANNRIQSSEGGASKTEAGPAPEATSKNTKTTTRKPTLKPLDADMDDLTFFFGNKYTSPPPSPTLPPARPIATPRKRSSDNLEAGEEVEEIGDESRRQRRRVDVGSASDVGMVEAQHYMPTPSPTSGEAMSGEAMSGVEVGQGGEGKREVGGEHGEGSKATTMKVVPLDEEVTDLRTRLGLKVDVVESPNTTSPSSDSGGGDRPVTVVVRFEGGVVLVAKIGSR
ncbi:hypothetical protein HK102_005652, partial [Quaeritorhiza haematococci]